MPTPRPKNTIQPPSGPVVTKELTCAEGHVWSCSRPFGARGTWPERCPEHRAARERERARIRRENAAKEGREEVRKHQKTVEATPGDDLLGTGLITDDLAAIDKLASLLSPDRKTFRDAFQRVVAEHSYSSYIRLAAVSLSAARLLNGHQRSGTVVRSDNGHIDVSSRNTVTPPPTRERGPLRPDWAKILDPNSEL